MLLQLNTDSQEVLAEISDMVAEVVRNRDYKERITCR